LKEPHTMANANQDDPAIKRLGIARSSVYRVDFH
jgi:hypothetical protein